MYRDEFREVQGGFYWTFPRVIVASLLVLVTLYAFGFLATGGDLFLYRFWAPKRANAERQVFEQTQSYVQGKVSYLAELRMEYESAPADDAHGAQRSALRRMILTESAQIERNHLPPDLNGFIDSIRGAQ